MAATTDGKDALKCAVSYAAPIPTEIVTTFLEDLGPLWEDVQVEDRGVEVFAGYEWLMPTAIVLFVTRKYFETFLEEAARDHYELFKAALRSLVRRSQAIRIRRMGSPGKVSSDPPGSVSLYYVLEEGAPIRFVFPQALGEDEEYAAVSRMIELLSIDRKSLGQLCATRDRMAEMDPAGRVIARYDKATGQWSLVDVLAKIRRDILLRSDESDAE